MTVREVVNNLEIFFCRQVRRQMIQNNPCKSTGFLYDSCKLYLLLSRGDVWYPFRVSHFYFMLISVACGMTATVFVTIFFSRTDLHTLDRRLVAPISLRWLPTNTKRSPTLKYRIVKDNEEAHAMLPTLNGRD